MERGSINGIPIWVKMLENTGTERTVVKEAPGVDGAVIETQGQGPQRWRLDFALISDGQWITDDYETATLSLRAAFLDGGPYTVSMPIVGELTDLWLAEPVTMKFFDTTRRGISEGTVTLIEAEPQFILQESAAAAVASAISRLSETAALDFARRVPAAGSTQGALNNLGAFGEWLERTQALINAAFEPVNNFSAAIQTLTGNINTLINTPANLASRFMSTAAGLMSLVPSLSSQGDTRTGSAAVQDTGSDKPAVVYSNALLDAEDFDRGVPTPQGEVVDEPSIEDEEELDEMESVVTLTMVSVTASVCLAITSTNFATLNSVLDVAEALEGPFDRLLNLDTIDYRIYTESRSIRAATRRYLSEQAAGLPRLRSYIANRDTDLLAALPDLYESLTGYDEVQSAVDSICDLNNIPDPSNIRQGTELRYLDPLT
jgi:hypothetical protein